HQRRRNGKHRNKQAHLELRQVHGPLQLRKHRDEHGIAQHHDEGHGRQHGYVHEPPLVHSAPPPSRSISGWSRAGSGRALVGSGRALVGSGRALVGSGRALVGSGRALASPGGPWRARAILEPLPGQPPGLFPIRPLASPRAILGAASARFRVSRGPMLDRWVCPEPNASRGPKVCPSVSHRPRAASYWPPAPGMSVPSSFSLTRTANARAVKRRSFVLPGVAGQRQDWRGKIKLSYARKPVAYAQSCRTRAKLSHTRKAAAYTRSRRHAASYVRLASRPSPAEG